jgi:polyhydroxybutyrate depolymerase
MRTVTRLDRHAADAGLAVAYPQAIDGGWGDDTFTAPGRPVGDEDVAFLDALIRQPRSDPHIDDGPIGVVGFSNGASMALRYTSEHPDDLRAVPSSRGQFTGGQSFGVTSNEVDASAEAVAFVLDPEGWSPVS